MSTLEYSLIFVLIVIGAIALWSKLGKDMDSQLARGEDKFSHMLQNASAVNSGAPGSASASGPVQANVGQQQAVSAPVLSASSATAASSAARAKSAPASSHARTHANTSTQGSTARAASQSTTPSSTAGKATPPPSAAAAKVANSAPVDGDWRSQKIGTGGKVAVVAGGAVAGAAMAAGTSIATAYVATLACGPGAPVCAGAVTVAIGVGLAGYGVHKLVNGGWSALKGSFSRVFSSDDATVGDALSVGTTLGAAAYGMGTTGLSGASGVARGQAIAQVGARAGAATRAEISSVLTGSTPELATAGVPNTNPVPGIVRMSGGDRVGGEPAAPSGAAAPGGKVPAAKGATETLAPDASRGTSQLAANNLKHLRPQTQRAVRSLEQRLFEHREKLEAFKRNPDAFDNKGFLKAARSAEVRQRISDGRVRHLENEIGNFERQIQQLLGAGG